MAMVSATHAEVMVAAAAPSAVDSGSPSTAYSSRREESSAEERERERDLLDARERRTLRASVRMVKALV
eukprot:8499326-Pyramimonas_sp.AAC.1